MNPSTPMKALEVERDGARVVLVIQDGSFRFDNRVQREARALQDAGYSVQVICPGWDDDGLETKTVEGIPTAFYPGHQFSDSALGYVLEYSYSLVLTFALLCRVWFRDGFDIVHLSNPPDILILAALPFRIGGVRIVFDHHDLTPELYASQFERTNSLVFRGLCWFEKLSCRAADAVIATNESYREREIQRAGISGDKVTVVRNGPDLDRFGEPPESVEVQKRSAHLVCYLGNMSHHDGVDYLIRAMHQVCIVQERDDVECVLIGSGSARPDLEALTVELGLEEHVRFTGRIPDDELVAYLSAAHICASPDPSGPLNDVSTMNKTMEYMAMGKPVVAFDLKETRVSAGDAALYATPNDTEEFARHIVRLVDDPALRRDLGSKGRRRVSERLAWTHSERELLKLYGELAPISQPDQAQSAVPSGTPG